MKYSVASIVCILVILIMNACYHPIGENFTRIEEPDSSALTINLDNIVDTIRIDKSTLFSFTISNRSLLEKCSVYVDGKSYSSINNTPGELMFNIDPYKIGDGIHKLELRALFRTGTGSLADMAENEKMTTSRQWVLIVDTVPPTARIITQIDSSQGTLTIRWNPYEKWNFKSYTIHREYYHEKGSESRLITLTDQASTEWTDDKYVGGLITYQINIATIGHNVTGQPTYIRSRTVARAELLPSKKIKLSWKKPTFYKNISEMNIYHDRQLVKTLTDFSDTVMIVDNNFRFGLEYPEAFSIVSQNSDPDVSYNRGVYFALGKRINKDLYVQYFVHDAKYSHARNQYYVYSSTDQVLSVAILDENFNRLTQERYRLHQFTLSDNGNHLYATFYNDGNGAGVNSFIFHVDPTTLDTFKTFSVSAKNGSTNLLSTKMEISDNNMLAYHYTHGHALTQMPDGNVLKWRTVRGAAVAISPDGKYYYDYGSVYELVDNVPTLIYQLEMIDDVEFASFRQDEPTELIIVKRGVVTIVKMPEMSIRTYNLSITFPASRVNYDPQSSWLLCASGYEGTTRCELLNIETGESFVIPYSRLYDQPFLINSMLLSQRGLVADVQFIRDLSE